MSEMVSISNLHQVLPNLLVYWFSNGFGLGIELELILISSNREVSKCSPTSKIVSSLKSVSESA